MRRLLYGLVLFLFFTVGTAIAPTAGVSAAVCSTTSNPLACACSAGNGGNSSAACSAKTTDPISGPNGILKKASLVMATLAGIAAVIIIIVGGFQYITSAGDTAKATGARKAIVGAVVGLAIIAVAESLVLLVVSKL